MANTPSLLERKREAQRLRRKLASLTVACILAAPGGSHSARPLATEDAGVLDRGGCEWEASYDRTDSNDGSGWAAGTQLGCGVGLSTQLQAGVLAARAAALDEELFRLAGKTRIFGDDESFSGALAYDATRRSGNDAEGAFTTFGINAILSLPIGERFAGHVNLGRRDRGDLGGVTVWAVALEASVRESLQITAETFGERGERSWWSLGGRWDVGNQWTLDAAFAWRRTDANERVLTLGFTRPFKGW